MRSRGGGKKKQSFVGGERPWRKLGGWVIKKLAQSARGWLPIRNGSHILSALGCLS